MASTNSGTFTHICVFMINWSWLVLGSNNSIYKRHQISRRHRRFHITFENWSSSNFDSVLLDTALNIYKICWTKRKRKKSQKRWYILLCTVALAAVTDYEDRQAAASPKDKTHLCHSVQHFYFIHCGNAKICLELKIPQDLRWVINLN